MALATAAAGLALPPLWFGIPGVISPPAEVRSLNLPTHTYRCPAHLRSSQSDSVHDNARQTIRVISSRKLSSHASHILSKHPVSYGASSHAASTLSIRASSLAANILSSTEHPSQCIEFAANIPLRAENPVLRQTSCRHRASVAAHSVRGKHPREHRSSSLTADIPPRAAHSVVL